MKLIWRNVCYMKTLHAINGSTKQSDEPELQTPCTSVPSDGMKDDLAEEDLLEDEASRECKKARVEEPLLLEDEASRECKKARVEEPLLPPTVQVNQEVDVAVAAGGIPRIEKDCKFNLAILHCSVCYDRLMPPVFQCVACLHSACATCQEKLPGKRCHSCDHAGDGAYVHSPLMDEVVRSARFQCAHHQHGCMDYATYFEAPDHESACPHAPCSCTEPGCAFLASPPNLLGHLASAHSWPMHNIRYGTDLVLPLPALETRVLLVAAEDRAVFVLSVAALSSARAFSVVCVRANGGAGQQYLLTHLARRSGEGSSSNVSTDVTNVRSSAAPGNVDVHADYFLTVPPAMMTGPQADKEIVLTVCINKKKDGDAA